MKTKKQAYEILFEIITSENDFSKDYVDGIGAAIKWMIDEGPSPMDKRFLEKKR